MRRVVVFALLALALPLAAWADGITLTNQDGTVSISGMTGTGGLGTIGVSTITSKGSELTQWNGTQAKPGGALGSVSFSTGALLSGSISGGGTFAAGGSQIVWSADLPANGSAEFFGAQLVATPGPGAYTKTTTVSGFHPNCCFDSQSLAHRATAPNQNQVNVSIVEHA